MLVAAWPVNFNYAIATFEPAVKGVKELVDLSLRSKFDKPPKFLFVSSVAVTRSKYLGSYTGRV